MRIPERRKRDEDADPSKRSEGGRAPVVWGKDCFIYVPLPSLASLTTLLLFKKSELFSVHRRNPPDSWCFPVSVEDSRLFVLSFRNIEKSVCVSGRGGS